MRASNGVYCFHERGIKRAQIAERGTGRPIPGLPTVLQRVVYILIHAHHFPRGCSKRTTLQASRRWASENPGPARCDSRRETRMECCQDLTEGCLSEYLLHTSNEKRLLEMEGRFTDPVVVDKYGDKVDWGWWSQGLSNHSSFIEWRNYYNYIIRIMKELVLYLLQLNGFNLNYSFMKNTRQCVILDSNLGQWQTSNRMFH